MRLAKLVQDFDATPHTPTPDYVVLVLRSEPMIRLVENNCFW